MFFIALLAFPGITSGTPLDTESHYCSVDGVNVTCLSLDPRGVAVLSEAGINKTYDAVCKTWGPLKHKYGLYHKSPTEAFTIMKREGSAEIQMRNGLLVSLDRVYPKSPKGLAAIFEMDEPNWQIEFNPFRPSPVQIHRKEEVMKGKVSRGYPYTTTWNNKEGEGSAVLVEIAGHDGQPEPIIHKQVIIGQYKPRRAKVERFLLFQQKAFNVGNKVEYWTDDRFTEWLEDVNKHHHEAEDISDWREDS